MLQNGLRIKGQKSTFDKGRQNMEEQNIQNFREDFALLIEAGFVAVKQLDEISATRIFQAAQAMNATSTAPQIGLGYIALNKLETKEATRIFEAVLKQEPVNYLAQTFLGICFLLNKPKRKKGEQLIREAMEKTTDPTIKSLGEISLEWAEKDLSKSKSPFFTSSDPVEEVTPVEEVK
jgi:lipopolysaccharide biosynthesis regulator YciM